MKTSDVCEVSCINEDVVNDVSTQMKDKPISSVSTLFKALADETRLKVAFSLSIGKELCVCDVANIIGSSTATASHHLRQLKKQGLAKHRKEGKLVYYSLDDFHVKQMIDLAFTHKEEVYDRGE